MTKAPAAALPPVAVGGVGGSGTRLVAQLLRAAGIHTGDDLNAASDTLWFTLLFKRVEILQCDDAQFDLLVQVLVDALCGGAPIAPAMESMVRGLSREERPQHSAHWLQQRAESLIAATRQPRSTGNWGWKEPNTHIVIERLWQRLPELRYVHVVRHGVDMAFSRNQNQLRLWGPHVLGEDGPITPSRSLAYWCRVHQRMQDLLAANSHRMYWLDYDALCRAPLIEAGRLCRFLGCEVDLMVPMLEQIRAAEEPRRATAALDQFDAGDLAFVHSLGYAISQAA
ncbi:MAG TPA: sulfotransferase [Lysobacter sp.]